MRLYVFSSLKRNALSYIISGMLTDANIRLPENLTGKKKAALGGVGGLKGDNNG